jgi:HK97 family phage prohead protease
MLYRAKRYESFKTIDRKSFTDFLKLQTGENGKLKEPVEIVMAGYIAKQTDADGDWFPWVFSTYDNDRFDERVDPSGWELDRYLENPVVLWAHCHSIPAIGLADNLTATDKLSGRIKFNAKEIDEFGWSIGERVKAGVIRAGSVGMLVKEIEWIDHKKNPEDSCDLIIRKQELLEFSICNVPANPFALRDEDSQKQKRTGDPTARSVKSGYWPLSIIN